MTSGDVKEYSVDVSDEFVARLRQNANRARDGAEPSSNGASPNFTIRYSTPPELLKHENCELNLRKSTRGEYIVEDASSVPDKEQGTGKDEGSSIPGSRNGSGPSFRGPGTNAHDDECVLIFNEEKQKYELHFLNINFQVAPVLKSRPRSTNSASNQSNSTNNSSGSLRERPPISSNSAQSRASSRQSPRASPRLSPATTVPSSPNVSPSKPLAASKQNSSGLAKPSNSPTKNATNNSNTASGALLPKTSTRARLPTRRKVTSNKPKVAPHLGSESPPLSPSASRTSSIGDQNDPPESQSDTPRYQPPEYTSGSTSRASTVPSPVATPAVDATSDVESGIDDAFDDLADELADELMEDEEDTKSQPVRSLGTAGGSAEDEDVSSEEE